MTMVRCGAVMRTMCGDDDEDDVVVTMMTTMVH